MVVGPDDQIMKVVTPCPESPGQWPEYPGVTQVPAGKRLEARDGLSAVPLRRAMAEQDPRQERPAAQDAKGWTVSEIPSGRDGI